MLVAKAILESEAIYLEKNEKMTCDCQAAVICHKPGQAIRVQICPEKFTTVLQFILES